MSRRSWAPPAALALVLVALFADAVLGGRILFERDVHGYWFGQVASFVGAVRSGAWPLWDPRLGFGQPLLATPSTQVLYPWTWLTLALPMGAAYTVYVVSHLLLGAIGLWLAARRWGVSSGGALAAGVVWMLSGPLLSLVSIWHHLAGACWMPWVLLAWHAFVDRPSAGRSALLGAVFTAQVLAGSADMCALTLALGAAHALGRLLGEPLVSHTNALRARGVAFAGLLAGLLSAALWLPALDFAIGSSRLGLPESLRTFWSVHPATLPQLLLPVRPHEWPLSLPARAAAYESREPFLGSLYLGLASLPLVAAALRCGGRRALGLAAVSLAALLVALGKHGFVYGPLAALFPPLQILRYPSKVTLAAALCWALLVGLGVDALRRPLAAEAARRAALAGLVAALSIGAGGRAALEWPAWGAALLEPGANAGRALAADAWRVAAACGFVVAGLVIALAVRSRHAAALPALLGVLAALDLFAAHRSLNPTALPSAFFEPPPLIRAVEQMGVRRLLVFDYTVVQGKQYRRPLVRELFPRAPEGALAQALSLRSFPPNAVSKLWSVDGSYDQDALGLYPLAMQRLVAVLRLAEETPAFVRLLRLGGVEAVAALHSEGLEELALAAEPRAAWGAPIRLYRVPGALPRAHVVGRSRVAPGRQAFDALATPGFDPAVEVLLDASHDPETPAAFTGMARVLEARADLLRVEAELSGPGYVVLAEGYDPGWLATLDGRPAPVRRANVGFRAVAAPAGRHVLEMVYRPPAVIAGLALSAAGLLLLVLLLLRLRRAPGPG